jgi:regulator of replication initiation timing
MSASSSTSRQQDNPNDDNDKSQSQGGNEDYSETEEVAGDQEADASQPAPSESKEQLKKRERADEDSTSVEERKLKRIVANRNSAKVSYQRRKIIVSELQTTAKELSDRNAQLTAENEQLRRKLNELKHQQMNQFFLSSFQPFPGLGLPSGPSSGLANAATLSAAAGSQTNHLASFSPPYNLGSSQFSQQLHAPNLGQQNSSQNNEISSLHHTLARLAQQQQQAQQQLSTSSIADFHRLLLERQQLRFPGIPNVPSVLDPTTEEPAPGPMPTSQPPPPS